MLTSTRQGELQNQEKQKQKGAANRSVAHGIVTGNDFADVGQETFLFGKWLGGGPPITAACHRPCPGAPTDVLSRTEVATQNHWAGCCRCARKAEDSVLSITILAAAPCSV